MEGVEVRDILKSSIFQVSKISPACQNMAMDVNALFFDKEEELRTTTWGHQQSQL